MITPAHKEQLRHAILEVLAVRESGAFAIGTIFRYLAKAQSVEFIAEDTDLVSALEFLAGLTPPLIKRVNDTLGATLYWQATSDGVLAYERGAH